MRYLDLMRAVNRKVKACQKRGAPDWLVSYAESSKRRADFFFCRRKGPCCPRRSRAMEQLLQLMDVLRHFLMSVSGPSKALI